MSKAYLSLGSNQGDRLEYLRRAIAHLQSSGDLVRMRISSVYETAPVGYVDQAPFLNVVVAGETRLAPIDLLRLCQSIEADCGRRRTIRWGPRTLDVDIIAIDDVVQTTDELTIPHPRAHERAFVLVPLLELEPNATLGSQRASELLEGLGPEQSVVLYGTLDLVELVDREDKERGAAGLDLDR